MTVVCEYCHGEFSRVSVLYKHQRSAKYCLEIQGKFITDTQELTCKYCNKDFTRKDVVKRHEKTCTENKDKHLLEMIIDLQKTIVAMADRPAIPTNTDRSMTMNLAPITDQELQQHLQHLTIDFIQAGAKGYADWANIYPFKDRIVCTDKARKKLRYKDNEGIVVTDGGGVKLSQRFFQAIAERNEEIINFEYDLLRKEVEAIAQGRVDCPRDLAGLLTRASNLQDLLIKSRDAARGEENELTREFINYLSRML